MIYLKLDENNYLLSVAKVGNGIETDIDLSKYDLSGDRIRAHKWDGEKLTFDESRFAEIEAAPEQTEQEEPTEMEQLRADIDYLAIMTGIAL